jgi:hypothetical protein
MANLNMFVGVMVFYALLSYIVFPLAFYFFLEKNLNSAGNGFVLGSLVSVVLWFNFRSTILNS